MLRLCRISHQYFNPRPPWGGRQEQRTNLNLKEKFQSTPSVGRATTSRRPRATTISRFQSTPSVGRATVTGETDSDLVIDFNPRPPWGGRRYRRKISCLNCHFNPRPPWGGRPAQGGRKFKSCKFQSTPSVGRATRPNLFRLQYRRNFNPRPPWGGRPEASMCPVSRLKISIHALRGEGDCKNIQICNAMLVHSAYKTVYFCDSCAFYLT